jgi:hypothetical protein
MPWIRQVIIIEIGRGYGDHDAFMEMRRGKRCNTMAQSWRRKDEKEK